jgi:hypothetical protein
MLLPIDKGNFMGKASFIVVFSAVATVVIASSASASSDPVAPPEQAQQPPASKTIAEGSIIAAIKDEKTSIVRGAPTCGDGTTLEGALVMDTPQRVGFPFTATTFASPRGTFTTVTTAGDESEAVIQEVARTLNARADNYVKRLLRNCSL